MNEIIVKRASLFSLILGAFMGVLSILPSLVGFAIFFLMLFCAPTVIIYMKKDEKYLGFLNYNQSAILGGIIGFVATIGFFAAFAPLVCTIKMIIKTYYAYMIPDMLSSALWLFVVIVFFVAFIFAMTNSASALGLAWIFARFKKKPKEEDGLDITIED